MKLIVHPNFASLRDGIASLASNFETQGTVLYNKRNQVRLIEVDGTSLVVKRFKHLSAWRAFIYRYLRRNKAQRAYENALHLLQLGFNTPDPVAWMRAGRYYYYICMPSMKRSVKDELVLSSPYNTKLVEPYAQYVAQLHESGVLHRDCNPSNVLYEKPQDGTAYSFELIDINRMRFYEGRPVPKRACIKNLCTLFWEPKGVFEEVVKAYADARGWPADDYEKIMRAKKRSNKSYARGKHFAHPIHYLRSLLNAKSIS